MEIRNGIRQPQAEKASLLIQDWVNQNHNQGNKQTNVAVIWMKLV